MPGSDADRSIAFFNKVLAFEKVSDIEVQGAGHLEQSDGTSWMGMYCLNMLAIALELAKENSAYEDVASKFFEHFVYVCEAMNNLGGPGRKADSAVRRVMGTFCRSPSLVSMSRSKSAIDRWCAVSRLESAFGK